MTSERPKIEAKDLKWDVVEEAAENLARIAQNAGFRAPELMWIDLDDAVQQFNRIAEALCFTRRR